MKISRSSIALLVGAGFAGGLAAGAGGGLVARQFGITPASAAPADQQQTYRLLNLFAGVFARVRANYVEPVSDSTLIDNALNGMLSGLDPHSSYLTAQQWHDMQSETTGQFGGIGLEVTDDGGLLRVVSPIDGTPAAAAGMQPGDLITAVNGRTVEGLSLTDAVASMRGPPDSKVNLTIKRQQQAQPLELALVRQIIHVQTVRSQLIGDIGVIRISEFTEQTEPGMRTALRALRGQANGHLAGLVLDLRNDPGGLLDQAVAVSRDFIDHGVIVSTRGRHHDDDHAWSAAPDGNTVGNLPVVVLINNGTASAAEIVAGALQDDRRAVVLGTRSFGKGSVQTLIPMTDAGAIRLTTARYYTPSGRSIQGLGISPDVEVAATRTPEPHFGPQHEADLRHILSNNAAPPATAPSRPDLPAAAQQIPHVPPADWPALDAKNPATDFQLQQGLVLVRAMAAGQVAVAR